MSGVRGETATIDLAAIQIIDADENPVAVASGHVRTAAGLKAFFSAMTAVATPATVSGYQASASAVDVRTGLTRAVPTGGVGPYTYLWEPADGNTWTINNDTGEFTSFDAPNVGAFDTETAEFKCTVTDDVGAEAETNNVTASVTNLGSSGGGPAP